MNILIEGWRGINHSYALVNQWQIKELLKSTNIFFKDMPYLSEKWNLTQNDSGFDKNFKNTINNLNMPNKSQNIDITYRIAAPYDFSTDFNSNLAFVFGTCEYKFLQKEAFKNGIPDLLNDNENFFIHTPSNWSKEGFVEAGFREDQVIVIPHGVDCDIFNTSKINSQKEIKNKFKINEDDFVLTNIGAMTKNKGVELLVAAYGILKRKFKNLKLLLKDQSNLYDVNPNWIFNKVSESPLNQKYKIINDEMLKDVNIISKNLSLEEIKEIYSITDCYISPYLAEGFNLTPLEAAACGTQIVVTQGGSTDDYFNECMGHQIESTEKKIKTNFSILEPKLESLVHILENKIINKPDKLKNNRSEYVKKNFSWEKTVKKLKKEFENKLNKLKIINNEKN